MPITIDVEKDYLYQKGVEQGQVEGKIEGKAEKNFEATANMLRKKFDIPVICEVLDMPESYVLQVQKELNL